MFDIGFSELLMIAVVALIVLGPERLPKAARFAGLWVRRARAQWYSVKSELERDLAADELRRSMQDAQDAFRDTEQSLRAHGDAVRRGFDTMAGSASLPSAIENEAGTAGAEDPNRDGVDAAVDSDATDALSRKDDDAPR